MTGVLIKGEEDTQAETWQNCHVKTGRGWRDATTRTAQQSKHWQLGEGHERVLPQKLQREPALPTPDSRLLASKL